MKMKTPPPRFPFLIIPFQGDVPGVPGVPGPQLVPAGEDLKKLLRTLAEIKLHIETNGEKMLKLMKKIVLLESALDEFLESSREKDDMENFFEQFVPVLDNLRFLQRAVEASGDDEWKKGLVIFYEKLSNLFLDFGFEPTAKKGMAFDPSRHESVETAVNPDLPPGSLADIILDGWTYKGRVLRFARVIVVKEKEK